MHGFVVATTCSPRNFGLVRRAGATYVFDYNHEEVLTSIQNAIPDLNHVFDTIGNATSSATAARSISDGPGLLCTVRPGKTHTDRVPENIRGTDVFVFMAFPKAHTYRDRVHWASHMPNHKLSVELFEQLPGQLSKGLLLPPPTTLIGQLNPSNIKKAMHMSRTGGASASKIKFSRDVD
ncbi:hypothetical protein J3459_018310 [Metarhizium acridum]|nr:hypothetical protein J3459_018310 [Metarhizium acridum]